MSTNRTPGGVPTIGKGQRQIDGTPTSQFSKPSKSGWQKSTRDSAPASSNSSGMEQAMGAHADSLYPAGRGKC